MDIEYWRNKLLFKWVKAISVLAIAVLVALQIKYIQSFASTWDQVDFALALKRYDIMAMQPHFPGYPYYILGGTIINRWIENPVYALIFFNILFYLTAIIPMYLLARELVSKEYSFLLASTLYCSTYVLVMVNEPMSEGAALAALWWYWWSIRKAMEEDSFLINLTPLFSFSVLLGIRLSYLPLGVGLIILLYWKWKHQKKTSKQICLMLFAAAVFQLIWVLAIILSEGSITGFVKLALAFTSGHFNDWGGAITASQLSILERFKILLFQNIIWTGISFRSYFLLTLYGLLFLALLIGFKEKRIKFNKQIGLPLVFSLIYFLWALFAQNIDKPRHILPIIIFIVFILLTSIFKIWKKPLAVILVLTMLFFQAGEAAVFLKNQKVQKPSVYQAAEYLEELNEDLIVYTWEETRVFEYLNVSFPHKKIMTYKVFLHDISFYRSRNIYLTGKVVEGFKMQGIPLEGKIKKIKDFSSSPIADPVYSHMVLYKWYEKPGGETGE